MRIVRRKSRMRVEARNVMMRIFMRVSPLAVEPTAEQPPRPAARQEWRARRRLAGCSAGRWPASRDRSRRPLILGELQVVQLAVDAAPRQQLLVRPRLDDLPFVEDDDLVGAADRR